MYECVVCLMLFHLYALPFDRDQTSTQEQGLHGCMEAAEGTIICLALSVNVNDHVCYMYRTSTRDWVLVQVLTAQARRFCFVITGY